MREAACLQDTALLATGFLPTVPVEGAAGRYRIRGGYEEPGADGLAADAAR
jgi:hypothetical protein